MRGPRTWRPPWTTRPRPPGSRGRGVGRRVADRPEPQLTPRGEPLSEARCDDSWPWGDVDGDPLGARALLAIHEASAFEAIDFVTSVSRQATRSWYLVFGFLKVTFTPPATGAGPNASPQPYGLEGGVGNRLGQSDRAAGISSTVAALSSLPDELEASESNPEGVPNDGHCVVRRRAGRKWPKDRRYSHRLGPDPRGGCGPSPLEGFAGGRAGLRAGLASAQTPRPQGA